MIKMWAGWGVGVSVKKDSCPLRSRNCFCSIYNFLNDFFKINPKRKKYFRPNYYMLPAMDFNYHYY